MRLLRARWTRSGTTLTALLIASLVAAHSVIAAFSMSAAHYIQRDLGRFATSTQVEESFEPGELPKTWSRIVSEYSPPDSALVITSASVPVDSLIDQRIEYVETDWSSTPYPGVYRLTTGRLPTRPNEIAVTRAVADSIGYNDDGRAEIQVFSGSARWTITGVVSDRFSDGPQVVAGPGTWSALPKTSREAGVGVNGVLTVLTNNPPPAVASLSALGLSPPADAAAVGSQEGFDVARQAPFALLVPFLILPGLAALAATAWSRDHSRRFAERAVAMGSSRRRAHRQIVMALSLWQSGAVLVGCVTGLVVGEVTRQLLDGRLGHPLGPVRNVGTVSGLVWLGVLCAVALAGGPVQPRAVARQESDATSRRRHRPSRPAVARLFLGGAAILMLWLVMGTSRTMVPLPSSPGTMSMVIGGFLLLALVLMSAEVVAWAASLVPDRGPASRFACRLLGRAGLRGATAFSLAVTLIALPLATVTVARASGSTARSQLLAQVSQREMALTATGQVTTPPSPDLVEVVLGQGPLRGAVPMRVYLANMILTVPAVSQGSVLAFDGAGDAERVLGRPMSSTQRTVLQRGGALTWIPGAVEGARLEGEDYDDNSIVIFDDVAVYVPEPEWAGQASAVVLTSTLTRQGVRPAFTGGSLVLVDVAPDAGTTAKEQAVGVGLDPRSVVVHHPPRALLPPIGLIGSAILLTIVMAMAIAATLSSHIRSMRHRLAMLRTIGVDPLFATRVVLLQLAVILTCAVAGAVLVAAVTGIALALVPNVELGVVGSDLIYLTVVLLGAMVTATAASLLALRRRVPLTS